MKKQDFIFIVLLILFFLPFFISKDIFDFYKSFNQAHGMIMSFIKFGILATLGEIIGLRIRTGKYYQLGFGILPRAIVWGFLGLTIKLAFIIFATGTPKFLFYMGIENAEIALKSGTWETKLLVAFSISVCMNLIYAPLMMTIHKITDTHIINNKGTVLGLFKPIQFGEIIKNLNWSVQWNFVFKKTITFLLPTEYQVLFAAVLGVVLGVLLAIASLKSK